MLVSNDFHLEVKLPAGGVQALADASLDAADIEVGLDLLDVLDRCSQVTTMVPANPNKRPGDVLLPCHFSFFPLVVVVPQHP